MDGQSVTADQVEQVVKASGRTVWKLWKCSICGCAYGYCFDTTGPVFNGACGCSSAFGPQRETWQGLADMLNMQTPEIRARMLAELAAK
jgi:hypothetical protein